MKAYSERSKQLNEAFEWADRSVFVPNEQLIYANQNRPLPIGYGQTISQPSTVRKMLEWLDVKPGQKVLDVGCGSGWTTALLSFLVSSSGLVYGIDIIPQLVKTSKLNCSKIGTKNVTCLVADSGGGLASHAPYDRILVSASAHEVPGVLLNQLAEGGKVVIPVKNDILVLTKTKDGWKKTIYHGFEFVPYIL